jgi:hypothetical protein
MSQVQDLTIQLDDLFNSGKTFSPQVFTTNYDLLLVSVVAWRIYGDSVPELRFREFDENYEKFLEGDHITSADYFEVERIVSHFNSQFTMTLLKRGGLSEWQKTTSEWLNNRRAYTRNHIGMIYRLPEFYHTDLEMEEMFTSHFSHRYDISEIGVRRQSGTRHLRPVKVIKRNLRSGKTFNYWMKDIDTGAPVVLKLEQSNSLTHLWDLVFYNGDELTISGMFSRKDHPRGQEFLEAEKWKVNLNDAGRILL